MNEIMKISGRKYFDHLQRGNYEYFWKSKIHNCYTEAVMKTVNKFQDWWKNLKIFGKHNRLHTLTLTFRHSYTLSSSHFLSLSLYIYIYISWPPLVKGDPKAPFSFATTTRCWKRRHSFLRIAPLTLDPYLIMLSVKQWGVNYHFFESLVWRLRIDPLSLGPLANTRTIMPIYICLATLKSSDRTKQSVCGWQYIYMSFWRTKRSYPSNFGVWKIRV